jgi:hypothetical protein
MANHFTSKHIFSLGILFFQNIQNNSPLTRVSAGIYNIIFSIATGMFPFLFLSFPSVCTRRSMLGDECMSGPGKMGSMLSDVL